MRVVEGPHGPCLLCAMADGAGTAELGAEGARLACDMALDAMGALVEGGGGAAELDRAWALNWLSAFQTAIQSRADAAGAVPRAYACTVMVALIDDRYGVFFQIGDGAMVIPSAGHRGGYDWVFWPARGEFANETWFATASDAELHLEWALVQGPIEAFAAFTDGLQHLVLHYETRTAHGPFFDQMFGFVEQAEPGSDLEAPLLSFLSSASVNERTDDDKSLILASRRGTQA